VRAPGQWHQSWPPAISRTLAHFSAQSQKAYQVVPNIFPTDQAEPKNGHRMVPVFWMDSGESMQHTVARKLQTQEVSLGFAQLIWQKQLRMCSPKRELVTADGFS